MPTRLGIWDTYVGIGKENMETDDIIYILLLFLSVLLGDVVRRIGDPKTKQNVSTLFGSIVVVLVSRWHAIHCLIEAGINGLIICFAPPKYCHGMSFTFSFLYLLFFRSLPWLGLPYPAHGHTNALLMLLTLKMVGLALEVAETSQTKRKLTADDCKDEEKPELQLSLQFRGVKPSFMDVIHYAFSHIGILTGPYYKFRTYWDMINSEDSQTSHLSHALKRLKMIPLYACLFLISGHYFPLSYAKSEEIFTDHSLLYRLWYMTPLFFTFRMRFYSGFILSEVACITSGLGAYPVSSIPKPGAGPTSLQHLKPGRKDVDYNFEAIHNIDEYSAEFDDVRGSLKSWNMTVQWWLVQNVHRRFPLKALRVVATMLVSAFWHGVHSGYYLSMLTVPFILVAEDEAKRKFRLLSPKVFDFVAGFAKIQWFSYMGVAFSLLASGPTLAYWSSVYFSGHVAILIVYGFARMMPSKKRVEHKKEN